LCGSAEESGYEKEGHTGNAVSWEESPPTSILAYVLETTG
jgi:hypothetical protein